MLSRERRPIRARLGDDQPNKRK